MEYDIKIDCLVKENSGWYQVAIKETVLEQDGRMPFMTWDVRDALATNPYKALEIAREDLVGTEYYEPIQAKLESLIKY